MEGYRDFDDLLRPSIDANVDFLVYTPFTERVFGCDQCTIKSFQLSPRDARRQASSSEAQLFARGSGKRSTAASSQHVYVEERGSDFGVRA